MQKIGISKCSNKNIKYYNKYIKNEIIKLTQNTLNKINSTIVNAQIIKTEFDNSTNSICILINLNIKIIYQIENDRELYIEEKDSFTMSYIELPHTLEGNITSHLFIQNKIKPKVYIENISSKEISNKDIIVNFYLITDLEIVASYCIGYIINNNLFSNIFISLSNGENIVQKTFTYDIVYSKLRWKPNSSSILAIENKKDFTCVCILNCDNKNKNTNEKVNVNIFVNNYDFIDSNKIVFDTIEKDERYIYTLNLKTKEIKKINTSNISKYSYDVQYNNLEKKIYFLAFVEGKNCLYKMDLKNNYEIVFDFINIKNYIFSHDKEKILIQVEKENQDMLFLLTTNNNYPEPINLDFEFDKILKMDLYKDSKKDYYLVILFSKENLNYIIKYSLNNFYSEKIVDSDNVTDFSIDYNASHIYICMKEKNFSQVIKINKSKQESILKIPGEITSLVYRS